MRLSTSLSASLLLASFSAHAGRVLTNDDLLVTLEPRAAENNKLLAVAPLPEGIAALHVPGDWLGSARWLVKIPVRLLKPETQLVFPRRTINDLVGEDCQAKDGTCLVKVVIDEAQQCLNFLAVSKGFANERYDLCVTVKDASLSLVDSTSGPFQHRQSYAFWTQGGLSLVTQKINNAAQTTGFFSSSQAATRLGIGAWWHGFIGEVHYRRSLFSFSSEKFEPRWLYGNVGYGFDLPKFWILTPHIELIGGLETYNNALKEGEGRFISGYTSPSIGFRSRFIVKTRLEIGGDLLYTYGGQSSKLFIQGDMRYWLNRSWAIGGGYWVDIARVVSETAGSFRETSVALESYVRYTF